MWDLDLFGDTQKVVVARKYILATECLFCGASGLIKVSILLFYRRLSSRVVSTAFYWTTWMSIGYIVAYSVALIIAPIVGCQPVSAFWDQFDILKVAQGYKFHCFDEGADVFAASIISVTQDLLTAMLPTFLYWNLRIPIRQKLALFGIFAIGYGVVALGAMRAYYSWYAFYETYDVTWATWNILWTSLAELHIGCLCANAPALKVFFKWFFQETIVLRSRSKTPVNSAGRPSESKASTKDSKSTSLWSKLTLGLGSESGSEFYSIREYHDTHNGVAVDPHGGVYVQKEVQVKNSPSSSVQDVPLERPASALTTDNMVDHYYDDIEMGRFTTRNSLAGSTRSPEESDGSEVEAVSQRPKSPILSSDPTPRDLEEGLGAPAMQQVTAVQQVPKAFLSVAPPVDHAAPERSPTPLPARTPSQHRPSWQTWS